MAAVVENHQTALVIGLGASGRAAFSYLRRRGWQVLYTDRDAERADFSIDDWVSPEHLESRLPVIDRVVVSPGVRPDWYPVRLVRERGLPIVSEIELFAESAQAPVLAVTGTNGKSTVTSLLGHMAGCAGINVAVGGNLGTPALELLSPTIELYVLELSSFQLEATMSLHTLASVVLNVDADHLDRYVDLSSYAQAKARIYNHAQFAVANRDDSWVAQMTRGRTNVISFGLNPPPSASDYGLIRDPQGTETIVRGNRTLINRSEIRLPGEHGLSNVMAAWAMGTIAGFSERSMRQAVSTFQGLSHRLELVEEIDGIQYYDDSKATNTHAASAAIHALPVPLVVIAGGDGKGQSFTEFADLLAQRARGVVLMGRASAAIREALRGRVPIQRVTTMDQAVAAAHALARAGDAVLLSPACSSLDMYRNYSARGDSFKRAVWALQNG